LFRFKEAGIEAGFIEAGFIEAGFVGTISELF
jgi:hypothetical protein